MTRHNWLQLRRSSIGGSDVGTILGFNKYKSPYQLWLDKTGQLDIDTSDPSEAAYWGNVFEETVANEFARRTDKKVRVDNHMYFHKDYPFLSANVDRRIVGENAILECKTASMFLADRWEDDNIPEQYIFQVQHYLNVLDKDYAYIAVLVGGQKFQWKRIERDQELIDIIQENLIYFWETNVLGGIAPEIDGSQATSNLIKAMYKDDYEDSETVLGTIFDDLINQLDNLKADKKIIETAINQIENEIKNELGSKSAGIGITPSNIIKWQPITSNRIDTKTLKQEQPDVYDQYVKTSSYKKTHYKGD